MAEKNISGHVTYKEGTHSNTATRRKIKNIPNENQLMAMKRVAVSVFEPLRRRFGKPIRVTSFFRSIALNKAIGGSKTSQHCKGEAMDLQATGGITNAQLFHYIKNNLDFDQLIWEFGSDSEPAWIHVSFKLIGKNRKRVLRAYDSKPTYRTYKEAA